jgi:hypothetical protein
MITVSIWLPDSLKTYPDKIVDDSLETGSEAIALRFLEALESVYVRADPSPAIRPPTVRLRA